MNKCTLLVDGNWLLMSRFSMNKEGFLKENSEFTKQMAKGECVQLMKKSIGLVLTRFENIIDNIILVCDGQSWRKFVEKPKALDAEYKGTRVKEEDLDWDSIYSCLKTLEEDMTKMGYTVAHTYHAEGDDEIWFWKTWLNKEKCNCIIWTSDNDLKQLVSYDDGVFTTWYNDRYGLFASSESSVEDDLDFFMLDDPKQRVNAILENMQNLSETPLKYINPEEVIMSKIICGDKSDNIKAVVRIQSGARTYSVTEKMWNEVKEKFEIHTLEDFFADEDAILKELYNLKKFRGTSMTLDDVKEQFEYNTKLVWLDDSTIPEDVKEEMSQTQYFDNVDLDFLKMQATVVDQKEQEEVEELLPF